MTNKPEAVIPIGSKKYRPFLQLGLGLAARYGVGSKGALLDVATRSKIPVPPGLILLDVAFQDALRDGYVDIEESSGESRLICRRPERLVAALNLPNFTWEFPGPFAIRPAFSAEDGLHESMAGSFTSHLNVDPLNTEAFARALVDVWESAARLPGVVRRDVLIMRMVKTQHSGVAFTESAYEDDLVNAAEGESLSPFALPRLRAGEDRLYGVELTAWQGRLQRLLRDVRRNFNFRQTGRDWEIEWADDGQQCYLLQVRSITRPTRRNEAFTIANHKEILLPLPSRFMSTLIASCADDLYGCFREFDEKLPVNRPLIEIFAGRPYLNLSLLTDTMRIFGLPTRLVTAAVGGNVERDYPFILRRALRKFVVVLRFAMALRRAASAAERAGREALARSEQDKLADATFDQNVGTLRWLYTAFEREMFRLTVAISLRNTARRRNEQVREQFRQDMLLAFERLRSALLTLADRAAARGQLPDRESLWLLDIDEVRRLDDGWQPEAAFWEARWTEHKHQRALNLPDLLHRFDKLDVFAKNGDEDS